MARATFVKSARKPIPSANIKVGDSYWWWKFRHGGKHVSKIAPKASQLTQSEFIGKVLEWQERDAPTFEDLESEIEALVGEMGELRDEQDEKYNNMPEGLQQGDTGQLLESRRDSLDSAISDLQNIDIPDEEGVKNDLPDQDDDDEETDEERLETAKTNKAQEVWDEVLEILGSIET